MNTFHSCPKWLVKFSGVIQIRVDGPTFTLIIGFAVYSGKLLNIFVHIGLAAQQIFGANSGVQPWNKCLVQALP